MKKSDSGAILFLVIIFSFIMSALGLAVIYLGGMDFLASTSEIDRVRVTNLADAGLEMGKAWIRNLGRFPEHVNMIPGQCLKTPITVWNNYSFPMGGASPLYGGTGRVTVTVDPYDDNDVANWLSSYPPIYGRIGKYLVTSTARIAPGASPSLNTVKVESVVVVVWYGDASGPFATGLAPELSPPLGAFFYKAYANSWKEEALQRVVY